MLNQSEKHQKPAVVQPIEENIDEGYTSEIQVTVEEQPREEEIVVVLGQHTAQQVPQSKVQPVQEVVSEEYTSEIQVCSRTRAQTPRNSRRIC